MTEECLVIGRGPSMDRVLDKEFDMDIICAKMPLHKDTIACCTVDLRSFHKKEIKAIESNIELYLGVTEGEPKEKLKKFIWDECPKEYHSEIITLETDYVLGSGLWTIEWAVRKGYKVIYSAGIDDVSVHMRPRGGVLPTRSLEDSWKCHTKLLSFFEKGVEIYKVSEESLLPVDVKFPPEKGSR